MTKQEITEMNERIGRESFSGYTSSEQPNWEIIEFSKDRFCSYDVLYTSGSTQDIIIGEIKFRAAYLQDAFDDWIIEQHKHLTLLETKRTLQLENPDKNIYIHYINFYKDNRKKPRIWDVTHPFDFGMLELPENSNTSTANYYNTPATKLHNNKAINL